MPTFHSAAGRAAIVVAGLVAAGPGLAQDPAADAITVSGTVSDGVECPILTTPDGEIFSLAASFVRFVPGFVVEVTGRPVEVSLCMQGTTISVSSVAEVPPSQ